MKLAASSQLGRELALTGREADFAMRRRGKLRKIDEELSRGNFSAALSLVKQLRGKHGGLLGFGSANQVPKKLLSMDELELNAVELSAITSLFDSVMNSIEICTRFDSLDEVPNDRIEILMEDEGYLSLSEEDHFRCVQHEAGHFLVGYLLGVLPRGYKVPSMDTLMQEKFARGSVKFVGFEFLKEAMQVSIPRMLNKGRSRVGNRVNRGEFSSKTLDNFSCVILGGLVAEHLVFGYSEGHYSDIHKLEKVFRWLGYRKSEADSHVRWAALNTALISHCNTEARSTLAEAMALRRSVGLCIESVESVIHRQV